VSRARKTVQVSAAVIESGGRVLIAQRRPGDHLALLWEFPGGKREPGETWEACLAREIREELGVPALVGALLDAATHVYADRTVELRFFRCELFAGTPEPLGCHAIRWVAPAQLARFEFPPADRLLVDWLSRLPGAGAEGRRARVAFAPQGRAADVPVGTHLEEAASRCGAALPFGCRTGACGACAVQVVQGSENLPAVTAAEGAFLARVPARDTLRLACQAAVLGDLVAAPARLNPEITLLA
jgi:mutator protein MutT